MEHLVGIDLGGTNIVCGLLNADGDVLGLMKAPTEASRGSDDILLRISGMVERLLKESHVDKESVLAVGMGTPGRVNPAQGISVSSSNLGWKNIPVAQLLQERIGCPVYIDNDVRMYVYGEATQGAGKDYRHVLGLTIGTGIASAFVSDGALHYGGAYYAGEIGHVTMEGLEDVCACGKIGCLETLVSAPGIAREARRLIQGGSGSILQSLQPDLSRLTSQDVSKAFDLGDEAAIAVMERTGKYLGRALAFAISVLSPDVVIIGGGAALAGDRLMNPMKEELKRTVAYAYWNRIEIKTAKWNEEAGVIGSALYAKFRRLKERYE
jgi:glucokinase